MLAAFEREEQSGTWAKFRELLQRSTRVSDLRMLLRELRAMTGAMSTTGRQALLAELEQRFGPDSDYEADLAVVSRVRNRGRIKSEREYRAVQSFADSIAGDPQRDGEFLALGALLDRFMAGG